MHIRTLMIVIGTAACALTACGGDDEPATSPAVTSPDVTSPDAEAPDAVVPDDPAPAAEADVMVASDDTLGDYLVDGSGMTLYLFTRDEGTTTACSGACADNWPPVVAAEPVGGEGIDAAQLATADGIVPNQITYHGHLLYYFVGDQAAGDTNGVGLPDWYAVRPDGTAIDG